MPVCMSAARHSNEFPANATMVSEVRKIMREYGIDDFSSGAVLSIQGLGTLQASSGLTRFEPASRRFRYIWQHAASINCRAILTGSGKAGNALRENHCASSISSGSGLMTPLA